MKLKFETFTVPAWSLPALINGDYSGLNDSDIENIKNFISDNNITGISGEISEAYFSHRNDVHNLGSDVVDIEISVSD